MREEDVKIGMIVILSSPLIHPAYANALCEVISVSAQPGAFRVHMLNADTLMPLNEHEVEGGVLYAGIKFSVRAHSFDPYDDAELIEYRLPHRYQHTKHEREL